LFGQDISGLNNSQLDLIKSKLKSNQEKLSVDESTLIDKEIIDSISSDSVLLKSEKSSAGNEYEGYFGYDYFQKDINFYDNTPTPSDFRLGPGDEVILSLWGEANSREKFIINKEGLIYYENIGFINISNKTLQQAESFLVEKLSRIYATLKDNNSSTSLMLELGNLKSVNVYFTGHVRSPGLHLIHPFSDAFSSIVQAQGILKEGSLRKVEIIRSNKVVSIIDFYSFFMNGTNTFSKIKIMDGDVIHVPSIVNRVEISGQVNRASKYEMIDGESLEDLLEYASGLTSQASSKMIIDQIIPFDKRIFDDNGKSSIIVSIKDSKEITLNNGDKVTALTIGDVDSKVTIFGRVKNPGNYPAYGSSLKDILNIAGGFDDPIFRQTIRLDEIIVLRKDSSNFYPEEINISYDEADQFKLLANDKIFVYEDVKYRNSFTYRVGGEVNKPGVYPLKKGMTVRNVLSLAGGLTELSTERNISLRQEFTEIDDDGVERVVQENINNVELDFVIGINSVVTALPFENVVKVEGNVYNPGLITYSKGAKLPRYIELAGGHKPNSLKNKVYIKRANGNIEQTNVIVLGLGKKIYPGDTIIVPVNENPSEFDAAAFTADILSVLANLVAILAIVDNNGS
jgi:protein involved in polysaccharide export with SLBB domain